MPQILYGSEGALNGITDVVVAAAPGASEQRIINNVSGFNKDTVDQTLTLKKVKAANEYTIAKVTVPTGENFALVGPGAPVQTVVLDATDESLEVVMGAAATTTNPDWHSSGLTNS